MKDLPCCESEWTRRRIREDLGTSEEHEDEFFVHGDFAVERDDDGTYEAYVLADGAPIKVKGDMYSFEEAVAFLNGVRGAKKVVGKERCGDEPKHPEGDMVKSMKSLREMLAENDESWAYSEDLHNIRRAEEESKKPTKDDALKTLNKEAEAKGVGKEIKGLTKEVDKREKIRNTNESGRSKGMTADQVKEIQAILAGDDATVRDRVARQGEELVKRYGENAVASEPALTPNDRDAIPGMTDKKEQKVVNDNAASSAAPVTKEMKDQYTRKVPLDNGNVLNASTGTGLNVAERQGFRGRKAPSAREAIGDWGGRSQEVIDSHAPGPDAGPDAVNHFASIGTTSRGGFYNQPYYPLASEEYGKKFLQNGGLMGLFPDQAEAMYPLLYRFQNRKDNPTLDITQTPILGPLQRWNQWSPEDGGAPTPRSMLFYGTKNGGPVPNREVWTEIRGPADIVHGVAEGVKDGMDASSDWTDADWADALGIADADDIEDIDDSDAPEMTDGEIARIVGPSSQIQNPATVNKRGRSVHKIAPSLYGSNQKVRRENKGYLDDAADAIGGDVEKLGNYVNSLIDRYNKDSDQAEDESDEDYAQRRRDAAQRASDDLVNLGNSGLRLRDWQDMLFDEQGNPREDVPPELLKALWYMDNYDVVDDPSWPFGTDRYVPTAKRIAKLAKELGGDASAIAPTEDISAVTDLNEATNMGGTDLSRYADFVNSKVPWIYGSADKQYDRFKRNLLGKTFTQDQINRMAESPEGMANTIYKNPKNVETMIANMKRNPQLFDGMLNLIEQLGRPQFTKTRAGSEGQAQQDASYYFDELDPSYSNLIASIMSGRTPKGWKNAQGPLVHRPVKKGEAPSMSMQEVLDMPFSAIYRARMDEMRGMTDAPPSPNDPNPMKANYRVVDMGYDKDSVWPMKVRNAETGEIAFEGNSDPRSG